MAESNLTVERNGREVMSRSWNLIKPDSNWRVMEEVIRLSASCEGGGVRWKSKRDSKAETMIAACRKAIENAPVVENLYSIGGDQLGISSIDLRIDDPSKLGEYEKTKLDGLIASGIKHTVLSTGGYRFSFPADQEGITKYMEYSGLSKNMWAGSTIDPWEFNQNRFDLWARDKIEKKEEGLVISPGMTIALTNGSSYKVEGEKITTVRIIDKIPKMRSAYVCVGIKGDGSETSVFNARISNKDAVLAPKNEASSQLYPSSDDVVAMPIMKH